jgi:hypothetical protein
MHHSQGTGPTSPLSVMVQDSGQLRRRASDLSREEALFKLREFVAAHPFWNNALPGGSPGCPLRANPGGKV